MERIPDFEHYTIDREGNIFDTEKKRKLITNSFNKAGYNVVNLRTDDGKRSYQYMHRLLAKTFIENPDNHPLIDHIDRNKSNYSLTNLRWSSYVENANNSDRCMK